MEAKYNDADVALTLAPSRRLAVFIAAASFATLVLLACMPGWAWARAAAGVWCVAIAGHALWQGARPRSIRIHGGTSICVDDVEGRVASGSFVAPWLTVVHWRASGARFPRTVVILPDRLDAERFRALRVVLRWAPPR
ncbi:MAG: hypothetical protein H7Y14_06270 [Burkholderiales bacterium]|nr:hypothetical protein [Burkholderiales bacterium]